MNKQSDKPYVLIDNSSLEENNEPFLQNNHFGAFLFWTQKTINNKIAKLEQAPPFAPLTCKKFNLTAQVSSSNKTLVIHSCDVGKIKYSPGKEDWTIPSAYWTSSKDGNFSIKCQYNTSVNFNQTGSSFTLTLSLTSGTLTMPSGTKPLNNWTISFSVPMTNGLIKNLDTKPHEIRKVYVPLDLRNASNNYPSSKFDLYYISASLAQITTATCVIKKNGTLVTNYDAATTAFKDLFISYLQFLNENYNPFTLSYVVMGKSGANYTHTIWDSIPNSLVPVNFIASFQNNSSTADLSILGFGIQTNDSSPALPASINYSNFSSLSSSYTSDGGFLYSSTAIVEKLLLQKTFSTIKNSLSNAFDVIRNTKDFDGHYDWGPFAYKSFEKDFNFSKSFDTELSYSCIIAEGAKVGTNPVCQYGNNFTLEFSNVNTHEKDTILLKFSGVIHIFYEFTTADLVSGSTTRWSLSCNLQEKESSNSIFVISYNNDFSQHTDYLPDDNAGALVAWGDVISGTLKTVFSQIKTDLGTIVFLPNGGNFTAKAPQIDNSHSNGGEILFQLEAIHP